jgi:SSS family solute:Na+ symporter
MNDWGLSGQSDFGFWPMLFGGLFLYVAYYGFDQSQAQRLLAAHDEKALGQVLLLNGVLRFPIVLAYCVLGLGLAAYALDHPTFVDSLPETASGAPNINLVFPSFVLADFPAGLAGLAIVGLFAAAMSSIDSALNSLSASTLEDFFPAMEGTTSPRQRFVASKLVTLAWGLFAIAFSFGVELIADTILEAINKVGSLVNGPLLGLFLIALAARRRSQPRALGGFAIGLGLNLATWLWLPQVSWLWWNVAGSLATVGAYLVLGVPAKVDAAAHSEPALARISRSVWIPLSASALVILALLVTLQVRIA